MRAGAAPRAACGLAVERAEHRAVLSVMTSLEVKHAPPFARVAVFEPLAGFRFAPGAGGATAGCHSEA